MHKKAARGRCGRPPASGSRAWETLGASGLHSPSLPLALPGKPGRWPALSEGTVIMRAVSFLGRPDYFFKLPCPHYLQEAGGSLHSGKSHNHCGPTFCQIQSLTSNRLPVPEACLEHYGKGNRTRSQSEAIPLQHASQQELAAVATLEPQGEFCSSCFCLKLPAISLPQEANSISLSTH